jgi:hypothetical protein
MFQILVKYQILVWVFDQSLEANKCASLAQFLHQIFDKNYAGEVVVVLISSF